MFNSRLMTALAFTALGAGAASAADLSRPYYKAPVFAEPYYNWGGFYVGGHLGGSSTNQSWTNTANNSGFGDLIPGQGFGQRGSGIFGGGQIGYNWQASNYVFGLEGSISGMNNRGTVTNTVFGPVRDDVFNWKTNGMATVTGRVGYALGEQPAVREGWLCRRQQPARRDRRRSARSPGPAPDPVAQRLDRWRAVGNTA